MLYIWGSGSDTAKAGSAGTRLCSICGSVQPFDLLVNYRYFHFWHLISWVTKRSYSATCTRCGNGAEVPAIEAKQQIGKDPIPFLRRKGWLIPIVALAILLPLGAYSSQQHQQEIAAFLDAPVAGDLYSVDLAQVEDSGFERSPSWGVLKLVAVDNGVGVFVTSKYAYDRKSDLKRDLRKGKFKDVANLDSDDEIEIPLKQLSTLREAGTLVDVTRE